MRFYRDDNGAVLVYVSLIIVVLVGITGLALDSGRLFTLRQELQKAADAAALAGAWQLDGTVAGSLQADAAARNGVITNNQKFGATPGAIAVAAGAGGVDFWRAVPADDDTALSAAAPPYNYIRVTTTQVAQNTLLARIFGAPATTNLTASAVAQKGQARCQQTPLFMCLPGGASFDPAANIGRQVLMKAGGGGGPGSWTNGNWGLLDTPTGSQSAGALANMLAGVNGLPQCITTGISTKPGNVASITPAFNVRFDIYDNLPGNVNHQATAGYPPAENVTKAKAANCNNANNDTDRLTRLGRDSVIDPTTRVGNGQWDCLGYWNLAHPSGADAPPAGCSSVGGVTRYETYLHEISNGFIPNTTGLSPAGDNGNRVGGANACYTGGAVPPTPTAPSQRINDRRIFVVAGVDCETNPPSGNTTNVPVLHFLSMFITEPAITTNAGPNEKGDVYMEIVGFDANGGGGLAPVQLREWVELVR